MRTILKVMALGAVVGGGALSGAALHSAPGGAETDAPSPRVPVLVELFTSEGCSSCPPADRVLATLIAQQPVPGALVIGLSEHVDYWDHQGWRDPYSSAGFTGRQQTYAREKFGRDQVYTPQLVVGGQEQLIGSDYNAAVQSIAHVAAEGSTVNLTVTTEPHERSLVVHAVGATLNNARIDEDVDVWTALTEDGLSHPVLAGENTGRTLAHTAVVRTLVSAGRWPRPSPHSEFRTTLTLDPTWRTDQLRVVAFAQSRSTRRVLGAASRTLAAAALL